MVQWTKHPNRPRKGQEMAKVNTCFLLDRKDSNELRKRAIDEGKSMQEILIGLVRDYLAKESEKR